jgi:Ca2+-binding EF-hand superfamily protein
MEKRVPFIAAATVAIVLSSGLGAEEYAMTFEQLDKDSNGSISAEEAKARPGLSDNFQASDLDGNGKLSIDEFIAFEGKGRFTPPEESEEPGIGAAPLK